MVRESRWEKLAKIEDCGSPQERHGGFGTEAVITEGQVSDENGGWVCYWRVRPYVACGRRGLRRAVARNPPGWWRLRGVNSPMRMDGRGRLGSCKIKFGRL